MQSVIAFAAILAVAAAQSSSDVASPVSAAPVPTVAPTAAEKCVQSNNCGTNTACVAACYGVPAPTEQQANQTAECFAKCPQTGDINTIADCRSSCINNNYLVTSAVKQPAASTSGSKPSGTQSGSKATGTSDSEEDESSGAASVVASFALAVPALAAVCML
ncbi:hypothetical protein IWQ60_011787 [Tieghemiomyces parasiticus]|uniref:Uncharacterized protein n=1 Tax=Tieghemiomyces parasiticus TaxID=78921 RepID=A0A9W7ZHZ5_9FUNG|nr:hypothetical protein IWQ60_011787 [Tieghemiomyces parasiticus]